MPAKSPASVDAGVVLLTVVQQWVFQGILLILNLDYA